VTEPTYLPPGTVLAGRYEIGAELGRGGYSVVYRASDKRIGSAVAIKLLVPPPAAARLARERLRREVQAVRQLSHPNIVPAYDVVDDGPWSFVVMELVDGPDLAVHVRRRGPLDGAAAARVGREIGGALDAAHRRGILHRDVKPQNILIAPDGRALLTDFGSARLAGQETVTQTGGLVGTLDYAAPEVRAGKRGDARSDEYALGVTLFFALTGALRPRGEPVTDCLHPRAQRPDVPGWLDDVIARATMADAELRFPAVRLMVEMLERRDAGPASAALVADGERCVLCSGPEPLGIGVCPRCTRQGRAGSDALLFLVNASAHALDARLGRHTSNAARQAATLGERPLVRVPHESAARIAQLLESRGLPTRVEGIRPAWHAAVPAPIAALATVVAVAGIAAGLAAGAPVLLFTSPFVAAGLAGTAAVGRRLPIWDPPVFRPPALAREAMQAAVRVLAMLPAGHARALLVDLLRRASATPAAAERAGPLIIAACDAVQDLAGLEQQLAAFDAQRDRLLDPPSGWLDALGRCERGRDLLTQRLLEASAALSTWQASESRGDELAELARDLSEEGQRQADAAREVAALLA
jgi:predicted Ser/Thr protein kinase